MPAQGRLKPFWRMLAVQLAADEVQKIKIELRVGSILWEKKPGEFQRGWGLPIPPHVLADAQEQWEAVMADGRVDES